MTIGIAAPDVAVCQDYIATPVTISKDKIKIDGKAFYSHIVLERQTLFSISKAYGVSIEEIYKYNPEVETNGLRKNDIINIPVVKNGEAEEGRSNKRSKRNNPEVMAYKESVVPEPVSQEPVSPEQIILTPDPEGMIKHVVSWYEDLSSIAASYKVSEEAIISANGLKSSKLKNKQILLIPVSKENKDIPPTDFPDEQESEDKLVTENSEIQEEEDESWQYYSDNYSIFDSIFQEYVKPSVNMTLALPFKANGKSGSRNNMDFYSGVLLAAKEITDSDVEFHLNVIDIANDSTEYSRHMLMESDIIIGPISSKDISNINAITGGSCPLVSPLDPRAESLVAQNSNMIQAPSSQRVQLNDIANWIKEDLQPEDKIFIISEKGARQNDNGQAIVSVINGKDLKYTQFSYSILEGRNIKNPLKSQMTETGVNRVVIASESEAFVNDAVRNLNLIAHEKYNVVLYAPSKIRSFETIEIENFHNVLLHTSLSYNIDYENEFVISFIAKYRSMFGTEPTQFAFQGYDLTKYFAGIIAKYGQSWFEHLDEEDAEMLQSTLSFKKNGYGGYINKGTRRVVYGKGYTTTCDHGINSSPVENGHSPQPEE